MGDPCDALGSEPPATPRFDPRAIAVAERTDIGLQRETNQDACRHAELSGGGRLLVVADGMGGHAGGETASRLAVDAVTSGLLLPAGDPGRAFASAMESANRAIREAAERDPELRGMGTTAVGLLFVPEGWVYVANVGDSRAYRLRQGELTQLTSDHSLVADLVRRGVLSEAQARVHPRRNELLRSLGVRDAVEVDLDRHGVLPGDCYLLCSDGLCGVVEDREILSLLSGGTPEEAAMRLVDAANERGGPDNVTVQIARIPQRGA